MRQQRTSRNRVKAVLSVSSQLLTMPLSHQVRPGAQRLVGRLVGSPPTGERRKSKIHKTKAVSISISRERIHFICHPSLSARSTEASVFLRNPAIRPIRFSITFRSLSLRKFDLLSRNFLPRDNAEQMSNAIQPTPFLVIRLNHIPRRLRCIRGLEHGVSCP